MSSLIDFIFGLTFWWHTYTNCVPWKRALGFVWLCKHWLVFYMLGWIYQSFLVASVKQDLYLGGWKSRGHCTMILNVIWLRDIRLVVPAKRKNCSSQNWCYDGHFCQLLYFDCLPEWKGIRLNFWHERNCELINL